MMQDYKQSTIETCLAVDLLQFVGKKISQKEELNVLINALKFDRENFTLGHLNYITKKYGLYFDLIIDNKKFSNFVSSCNKSRNINISQHKIDLKFLDKRLEVAPLITYIDTYPFWKINHSAHFIIIINKVKNGYKMYDPWDGIVKNVDSKILAKGIINLRNLIKNSPVIIQKIDT